MNPPDTGRTVKARTGADRALAECEDVDMTRAQEPDSEIDYSSVGAPGAARTVVVLRTGAVAVSDPAADVTDGYDVRLVLIHLDVPELEDPATYGGETPAGSTAAALVTIVKREHPRGAVALVGDRATTAITLGLAADLGSRVDRLAVVAPFVPEEPLERDLAAAVLADVQAGAIFVGSATEPRSLTAARWFAGHVAHAEVAELPEDDIDSADGTVGLSDAWSRVLRFVAGATVR